MRVHEVAKGGPGLTDKAGIAVVTTLAVHDESERCTSRQKFHAVETGGPEAAIAAAVRYLDSCNQQDRLRKVQSDIRGGKNQEPNPKFQFGSLDLVLGILR